MKKTRINSLFFWFLFLTKKELTIVSSHKVDGNDLFSRAVSSSQFSFIIICSIFRKFHLLFDCSSSLQNFRFVGTLINLAGDNIKKEPVSNEFSSGWWQRSIFSGRLQPNIVDVWELNFCVRNGNKWILSAIITIMVHWTLTFVSLEQWQLHTF